MDTYELTAQAFRRRIDCIAGAVDAMAPGLEAASRCIFEAALQDRKVLVVACADDAPIGQYLVNMLRAPGETLPAVPAILLTCSQPTQSSLLWNDLRTLSRDGDVLLTLDSVTAAPLAQHCSGIAVQRNLVAISLSESFEQDDSLVCVDLRADDDVLRRELLLMACHCLREQFSQHILGG